MTNFAFLLVSVYFSLLLARISESYLELLLVSFSLQKSFQIKSLIPSTVRLPVLAQCLICVPEPLSGVSSCLPEPPLLWLPVSLADAFHDKALFTVNPAVLYSLPLLQAWSQHCWPTINCTGGFRLHALQRVEKISIEAFWSK